MNFDLASEVSHGSYYAFQIAAGHLSSPENNQKVMQEDFAFRATSTVALCSDAVARLMLAIKDDFDEAKHLTEACNLFLQEEVPEMAHDISKIVIRG